MIWVGLSALYLLGLAAAVHAALSARTAQGAVAWAVSLVAFPFAALPAYLVFGRNRFAGMAEAFREKQSEISAVREDFQRAMAPCQAAPDPSVPWYGATERLVDFRWLRGNAIDLLVDGAATFDSILAGIEEAQHYVLVQFYEIHADDIGCRVRDALIRRAGDGLRVYVLFDEIGSHDLPRAYCDELQKAGVEVSAFRTTRGRGNRLQLNFRNHRKIVVVDGCHAWTGGLNVGDEYLGKHPRLTPWRDTHVHVTGPVVLQLQLTYYRDWYWATREEPALQWRTPKIDADDPGATALVVATGPDADHETASLFFLSAISEARQRLWIAAPYFVPDEAVMKGLKLAAMRGVDLRILATGLSDNLPVQMASSYYLDQLQGLGIDMRAFAPGIMHQKVMVVDETLAYVGSHNFDNRSFRLNFEAGLAVVDDRFAAEVADMFEKDFASAQRIEAGDFDKRGLAWRLGARLARLAAPVL